MAHLPSHFALPVVRVKSDNEDGFVEINESDFDSAVHELYKESKKKKVEEVEEVSEPADANDDGLEELTKNDLREMAFTEYGVQLSPQMTKAKMIAAIRDLRLAE